MDKHILKTIFRRWINEQSISKIHREEGFDRKKIRDYIQLFEAKGYRPEQQLANADVPDDVLEELLPKNSRGRSKRDLLIPYREELIQLVNPDRATEGNEQPSGEPEPVKPKTAYLILVEKYNLEVSYETFKLYAREIGLVAKSNRTPTRLESPPGRETQIDYGTVKVCSMSTAAKATDKGKKRTVVSHDASAI